MEKKKQILDTALKLFVASGFHGTPTATIAKQACVANGTLFHHFKTKDELVVALYVAVKDDLAQSMSSIIHESDFITPKFKNVYINTLRWALKNPEKFYYIQQFELSPHRNKISSDTIQQQSIIHTQLFAEGIKKKLLKDHPLDLILSLFNTHVFGMFQYLSSRSLEEREQMAVINEGYEMIWGTLKYM